MKKLNLKKILLCCISAFLFFSSYAQTLVNRDWVTTGGNPNEHYEFVSSASANGYIYIIGSTYRSTQQDNYFIAKIEDNGTIHWIKEFNSVTNYRDFGISIVVKDSLVVATGMSWDSATNNSQIVTLRLNENNGNIVWTQSWGSRYNIPVKMVADNSGNIYVGGTAQTSPSEFGMVVLKYNPSGSLLWESIYDSVGVMDGAVALLLDSPQNYLTVTGYTGNGFANWNFATVKMETSSGNIKTTTITQNPNGGFSKPIGISSDNIGNTYIGGTAPHPTTATKQMKLIVYDTLWQVVYTNYWGDSTTETEAADMHNDWTGGNVLLGTHTRADGYKEIVLARYLHGNSAILWERKIAMSGENVEAGSFTIAGDANNIYLTGSIQSTSGRHRMLTAAYDLDGNLMWMKEYNRTATSDDRGKTVDADEDGNPIVTGVSTDNDTATYVSVKYSQWEKPNTLVYSNRGEPVLLGNQVIVKFDPSVLNTNFIDEKELQYGDLNDFLKPSTAIIVQDILDEYCIENTLTNTKSSCEYKLSKVFKQLKSTQLSTVSRLGETIKIPDFWTTLLLTLPPSIEIGDAMNGLNTIPDIVIYTNPNYLAKFLSATNDSLYLNSQPSLHPTSTRPNADINIEPAWTIVENGDSSSKHIKVGVFDSGIDWKHNDFSYDGTNSSSSKVKGGWNFSGSGYPLKSLAMGDIDISHGGHGTSCSGIIAATRNNLTGIAGIAGARNSGGQLLERSGVDLYGMCILNNTFFKFPLNYIADAIVTSSILDSTLDYGYGFNVTNNSWGFDTLFGFPNLDSNITILSDAVHFANRANVTFVAARGDWGWDEIMYPAVLDDDWILSVTGTGRDGCLCYGTNCEFDAPYGHNTDVAAPADTITLMLGKANAYLRNAGTSYAAPHVTGVVGLLMNYLDSTIADYKNLAPEDCEAIIQLTATNINSCIVTSSDDPRDYGRLNAGKAFKLIEKPYNRLLHFGTNSRFTYSKSYANIQSNDTIVIPERYQNYSGQWFAKGKYIVNTYKVDALVNNNLTADDSIVAFWPRPSSSTLLPLFDSGDTLVPHEKVKLNSCDTIKGELSGYIYEVSDTFGNPLGWWPFDTSYINTDTAKFEYTILSHTKQKPIIPPTGINTPTLELDNITLFPNPSNNHQTIIIKTDKSMDLGIILYDISGRKLRKVFTGKSENGLTQIETDVSDLDNTVYIYEVKIGDTVKHIRFLKD